MATLQHTLSISGGYLNDLANDETVTFATNGVYGIAGATLISASLYLANYKTYAASFYMQLFFDSVSNPLMGVTPNFPNTNSALHSATYQLTGLNSALISTTPTTIVLRVKSTSGTGNKINFRDNATGILTLEYSVPSGGTVKINVGGVIKEADPYVKNSGVWKLAEAYVRNNGTWQKTRE